MYWPRFGTSRPSSLSIASAKACSWFIGADVVEPVEIWDRLQIGLVFDQLLGAAMQKADMRIDTRHDLAVEIEDETQHAMRGGVLRSEIDRDLWIFVRSRLVHHAFFSVPRSEWRVANSE